MSTTITKKAVKATKTVAAFFNWSIVKPDGSIIKCDKGMPIFQNPEYPSAKEDLLVELAEANGGSIELNMKVRVALNVQQNKQNSADLLKELMGTPVKVAKKKVA